MLRLSSGTFVTQAVLAPRLAKVHCGVRCHFGSVLRAGELSFKFLGTTM